MCTIYGGRNYNSAIIHPKFKVYCEPWTNALKYRIKLLLKNPQVVTTSTLAPLNGSRNVPAKRRDKNDRDEEGTSLKKKTIYFSLMASKRQVQQYRIRSNETHVPNLFETDVFDDWVALAKIFTRWDYIGLSGNCGYYVFSSGREES